MECWDAAQVYRLKVLKGLESLVLYEVAEGDLVFVTRGIRKMEYLKKLEVSVDSGVTWKCLFSLVLGLRSRTTFPALVR